MESGLLLHGRKFCLAMYVTQLIDQVKVNTLVNYLKQSENLTQLGQRKKSQVGLAKIIS